MKLKSVISMKMMLEKEERRTVLLQHLKPKLMKKIKNLLQLGRKHRQRTKLWKY